MNFEENKDETIRNLKSELSKEKRNHTTTKNALVALEKEYRKCEDELSKSHEEKERMKIKEKDLTSIIELNTDSPDETVTEVQLNNDEEQQLFSCKVCEYPIGNKAEMINHIPIHNMYKRNPEIINKCNLCTKEFISNNDFREHIRTIHTHKQFNCQDCDFQASSQIILNKHNNLKHKEKNSVQESTFKCSNCDKQFSAM